MNSICEFIYLKYKCEFINDFIYESKNVKHHKYIFLKNVKIFIITFFYWYKWIQMNLNNEFKWIQIVNSNELKWLQMNSNDEFK